MVWFESVGHVKLTQTNKTFSAKILKKKGQKETGLKFSRFNSSHPTIDYIASLPNNTYGLPNYENLMLADAILTPNIMVQFTVEIIHGNADYTERWGAIRARLGGAMKDHKLVFVIPAKNFATFACIGVPDDLECYYMTWEDLDSTSVVGGIKRKHNS